MPQAPEDPPRQGRFASPEFPREVHHHPALQAGRECRAQGERVRFGWEKAFEGHGFIMHQEDRMYKTEATNIDFANFANDIKLSSPLPRFGGEGGVRGR